MNPLSPHCHSHTLFPVFGGSPSLWPPKNCLPCAPSCQTRQHALSGRVFMFQHWQILGILAMDASMPRHTVPPFSRHPSQPHRTPIATPSCHQMPTTTRSNVPTNHSELSGIDRNHSELIGTCLEVLGTNWFHSVPLGTCGAQKSTVKSGELPN